MASITTQVKDSLSHTKEYARKNPMPVLFGALALGAAVGCVIALTRREEPSLRERFVDQPLSDFREAVYAALAPVSERLHDDYASARKGAERTLAHTGNSLSNQLGRVSRNLKFW